MLNDTEESHQNFNPSAGAQPIKNSVSKSSLSGKRNKKQNVGNTERLTSFAAGSILTVLGLSRRSLPGLVVGATGAALAFRGTTGHCALYEALDIDTSESFKKSDKPAKNTGIDVSYSLAINSSPEELYSYWRKLSQLPRILTHIESIEEIDSKRSRWIAKPIKSVNFKVEWEAEITRDEPNQLIEWRSLPSSMIETHGSIRFTKALGDRGTAVRVSMRYSPPGGEATHLIAKMFGKSPQGLIRSDLLNLKRLMESGEIPTVAGQSRGSCLAGKSPEQKSAK